MKRLTRKTKSNYEINVASQAKTEPKRFFQVYKTKIREELCPLKTANGVLVSSGEGISRILNVFTQENMQDISDSEHIFRAEESEKLTDISVNKEVVEKET